MQFFGDDIRFALNILEDYWWAYLPVLLGLAFYNAWMGVKKFEYISSLQWVMLKIKPPPQLDRSLKAVEQIYAGLHGIYIGSTSWKNQFFKGKVQDWFSLEIVGEEGGTDFYVRTPENYKSLVMANIFAQYPDAEISEAEDYMQKWPAVLPNEEYDLFGSEFILSKDNGYPIQTYLAFEEKAPGLEGLKRLDPLAAVSEVFSIFQPGEHFVIQILIRPTNDSWVKEAQKIIDGIMGKKDKKETGLIEGVFKEIDALLTLEPAKKEEKKEEKRPSAVEVEVIKAIGQKTSKLGFKTSLRLMYIARKENFHRYHFASIVGAFRQFASLNSFKPNSGTMTFSKGYLAKIFPSDKGFLADQLVAKKKIEAFQALKGRAFPPEKYFILNTEELATIFHLPGLEVKAPLFPRVEAKKGQPPPGLAIE